MADNELAPKDRGTVGPLIFGGALAAALGFFGSQIESIERALGLSDKDAELHNMISDQAETISAQALEINDLKRQLSELPEPAAPVDLGPIQSRLSDLDALASRLDELEKRPMTDSVSDEAIAAYEAELDAVKSNLQAAFEQERAGLQSTAEDLRSQIEALLSKAEATETDAGELAKAALVRASVARIVAAVDTGSPFPDALSELEKVTDVAIPTVLTSAATDGVATLATLQSDFPPFARNALAAARAEAAAKGESSGLGAFLQRQLGARSVTPQEGNSPDAILSRAEAAVRSGELEKALSELDGLPETAQAEIAIWRKTAETRHGALMAAQELLATVGSN